VSGDRRRTKKDAWARENDIESTRFDFAGAETSMGIESLETTTEDPGTR
jgi:hypothetical protein